MPLPPTKSAPAVMSAISFDKHFLHVGGIKPYRTETFNHRLRKFDIMEPLTIKDLSCAGLAILLCLLASCGVLAGTGMVCWMIWRALSAIWN